MATCQICRTSGPNMVQCTKCHSIWCTTCAHKGVYPGIPKQKYGNQCPVCGAISTIKPFR